MACADASPYTWSDTTWKSQFPSLSTAATSRGGSCSDLRSRAKQASSLSAATPGVPVVPPGGAVHGGRRGSSAVRHRGISHGREGLQPVPPTLGAVAAMVRPWMITTMPLPPQSVIVVIVLVVLALAGGIIVGSGTRGGHSAVPGSWKCSVEKRRRTRRGEMRGGEVRTVRRDRVRERGESRGADTLGGIRSKICRLGTLG